MLCISIPYFESKHVNGLLIFIYNQRLEFIFPNQSTQSAFSDRRFIVEEKAEDGKKYAYAYFFWCRWRGSNPHAIAD